MLYPKFSELVSYKDLKQEMVLCSYRHSQSLSHGGQCSLFRGQGLEFDSVRKYVPGDDIRNIDWKVTARTGSPHLKIFQEERQRHILLCIDMNASMRFGTRKTFKSVQAARIASFLGWQGMAHQDKISACLFGDVPGGIESFTSKRRKGSFLQLLKRLSQPNSEKNHISLIEAFRILSHSVHTGSLVYFISDFMNMKDEKEQDVLLNCLKRKCDVIFISINDPSDKTLIPVGKIGVCSLDYEKFVVNTDSLAGRKAYALQWEENRVNLYQKTAKFGIPLIELSTESDIKKDLYLALKSLSKKSRQ